MNFFEAQDQARRKSRLLVIYFILAVVTIVVGINLAAYFAFFAVATQEGAYAPAPSLGDPERWFWISLLTIAVIAGASLLRTAQLRGGGGKVARSIGGRKVDVGTRDPLERRLTNVVEEMAIASGVPVPEVYVLDQEQGINAFAAGHHPGDAAIGITKGALEALDRDELQGVIAHEFSHILNGDMRINVRMIGILFGILMIAIVGRILLHASAGRAHSGRRDRGGGAIVLFGLAIMIIGFFGEFFGRLIQSALSRQREFLADAAAVQFTRNPGGIAGALKTIGGASARARIGDQKAAGMAHCFFANAMVSKLGGALATHPPLDKRIRAIEPDWDGTFFRPDQKRAAKSAGRESARPAAEKSGGGVDDLVRGAAMIAAAGALGPRQLAAARRLIEDIPPSLRDAVHDPEVAGAVVLALVIDEDETQKAGQLQLVREHVDAELCRRVEQFLPMVHGKTKRSQRLPLAELCLPALQGVPRDQKDTLLELVDRLIRHDQEITLHEFCLATVVEHRLAASDRSVPRTEALPDAVSRLLSKVAEVGAAADGEARAAFDAGAAALRGRLATPTFHSPGAVSVEDLKKDLEAVRHAGLQFRKSFLEACEAIIRKDQTVTPEEADLFRLIAIAIDCPMPLIG